MGATNAAVDGMVDRLVPIVTTMMQEPQDHARTADALREIGIGPSLSEADAALLAGARMASTLVRFAAELGEWSPERLWQAILLSKELDSGA